MFQETAHDSSEGRPSRAKKRPDWMDSYHLDTDKGPVAKKKEDEATSPDSGISSPQKQAVTVTPKSSAGPSTSAAPAEPRGRGRPPKYGIFI